MARRKGWGLVMDGIKQALEVGIESIKLNCVVVRGFNDDEFLDFCQLAYQHPIEVRFVEFMPFFGNQWQPDSLVPYREMLSKIRANIPELKRLETGGASHETSKVFRDPTMVGSIGFITSMTEHFCSGCNRLRLTADGNLKVCLFERNETSLRDLMRNGASDHELVCAIRTALAHKKKQHAGE